MNIMNINKEVYFMNFKLIIGINRYLKKYA